MPNTNDADRRLNWLAAWSFILFGLLWTYIFGKDINFDFRNYHLYSGAALLHWRLEQDYFPAAVSGYLNAVAELPVYAMVMGGWNDFLMACVLMLMHLPNMLIIWKLAELIIPGGGRMALFSRYAATLLAFIAPLQLTTLSNTFSDPTAGTFTLLGIYFLVASLRSGHRERLVLSGIFFGVGAGLKLTNLLFLPAAIPVAVAISLFLRTNPMLSAIRYAAGTAIGFLVINGWWAVALWRKFGNPIFPLYNTIFKSPDFILKNFSDERMLHDGRLSWATLPFTMLSSRGMMYAENPAPDIRLICTVVLLLTVMAIIIKRGISANEPKSIDPANTRPRLVLWILFLYFSAVYLTWGLLSGIGRYAYVLWLLIGPIFVGLLAHYTSAPVRRCVVVVVIVVQLVVQFLNPGLAWSPQKWGGQWVNLTVPQELKDSPATYLLYGVQSNSFIIPFLHPDSRFVNIVGQYVQPVGERMHGQLKEFLRSPIGPTRVVMSVRGATGLTELSEATQTGMDAILSGYGFKISNPKCQALNLMGESLPKTIDGDWSIKWKERRADLDKIIDTSLVCDLSPLSENERNNFLSEYSRVDPIFDAVEQACGRVLAPHGVQTINLGHSYHRVYFNSLMVLTVGDEDIWIHPNETLLNIPVGTRSEFEKTGKIVCPDIRKIKNGTAISFERSSPTTP